MNWAAGFSATYRAYRVNPDTWEDETEIPVVSGSITRDMDDDLIDSASIVLRKAVGEIWIRIYLIAEQNGGTERIPLFTGLTSAPTRDLDGTRESYAVDCYGRLKAASDMLLPLGYYVAAGAKGAETIIALLRMAGITATAPQSSSYVMDYIIAEAGETVLTMARRVASAIGWLIRVNGRGEVSIQPYSSQIRGKLSNDNDIMEMSVTDTDDWYSCPNVLRVTSGSLTATAYDDDPSSPLSVPARGRQIWRHESATLSDASLLPVYAQERLKALQQRTRIINYTRRFNPDIYPGDLISVSYPQAGLTGNIRVMNQTISLSHGAKTGEEAYFEN